MFVSNIREAPSAKKAPTFFRPDRRISVMIGVRFTSQLLLVPS
jgi:hypothetical protein